jgi:hypothetical protein
MHNGAEAESCLTAKHVAVCEENEGAKNPDRDAYPVACDPPEITVTEHSGVVEVRIGPTSAALISEACPAH